MNGGVPSEALDTGISPRRRWLGKGLHIRIIRHDHALLGAISVPDTRPHVAMTAQHRRPSEFVAEGGAGSQVSQFDVASVVKVNRLVRLV